MIAHFKDDPEVVVIGVQTTFEGFFVNTFGGAKRTAKKYDLEIPIGHSGSEEAPSVMMKNYRTGGTPWVILIDKQGIVRFNHYFIEAEYAIKGIKLLKKES